MLTKVQLLFLSVGAVCLYFASRAVRISGLLKSSLDPQRRPHLRFVRPGLLDYGPDSLCFKAGARNFSENWLPVLEKLHLDDSTIESTDDAAVLSSELQFITAFDDSHASEAEALLKSFNKHFSNKTIWLYDIGLSKQNLESVQSRKYISVRRVNFSQFPDYVIGSKNQYRWKPIVIATALLETKAILWADASVVVQSADFSKLEISKLLDDSNTDALDTNATKYPVRLFDPTGHSIFATTDMRMVDYFPANESILKRTEMYGATVFAMYATAEVKFSILRWLVLCALEADCMSPQGTGIYCSFAEGDRYNTFAKCHRYDQSALNLLLMHASSFQLKRYIHEPPKELVTVERG